MKTILNLWVKLNEAIWGFEVLVQWDGSVYRHAAKNVGEAIHWAYQYPTDACWQVLSFGNDRIIASRGRVVAVA